MNKIEEAKLILKALGLPKRQQNERSALTLLALCNLKPRNKWSKAEAVCMSVMGNKNNAKYEGIMRFIAKHYNKKLFINPEGLEKLRIPIDKHSKLPDVVLYDNKRNWLYLVEAVTSHGPVSPKRIVEMEQLLTNCDAGKIYVTAFPDFKEFNKHVSEIAWETEVWVVNSPDHMIHFNGDKFIGPR